MASPFDSYDTAVRCPFCQSEAMDPYHGHVALCRTCGREFARHHEEHDLFRQVRRDAADAPHFRRSFWDRLARLLRL